MTNRDQKSRSAHPLQYTTFHTSFSEVQERETIDFIGVPEQADIYLLGAGQHFPDHMTFETWEVLEACVRVYTLITQDLVAQLPPDLNAKFVSLWPLYHPDRPRMDNYRDVVRTVLQGAYDARPIAFLTPGHPRLFDTVSDALLHEATRRGLTVRTLAGISCMDTVIIDINYDPANGLFIHDATAVVLDEVPLIPTVAVLLLQPDVFASTLPRLTHDCPLPDLSPLRDYLCRFYPPEHWGAFVRSATGLHGAAKATWFPLGDMAVVQAEAVGGTSLFVPPVISRRIQALEI